MIFWVIWISARLGSGLPDGWLWTRISAAAPMSIALWITLRGWIAASSISPSATLSSEIRRFCVLRWSARTRSCVRMRHVDVQVIEQRLPARQNRQFLHCAARKAAGRNPGDPQRGGGGFLDAGRCHQRARIGVERRGPGFDAGAACARAASRSAGGSRSSAGIRSPPGSLGAVVAGFEQPLAQPGARWPDVSIPLRRTGMLRS